MRLLTTFLFLTLILTAKSQTFDTESKYTVSDGKSVRIQNSLPKGGIRYTHPSGKQFGYVIFWTSIINESTSPLELTIQFPADSFFLPSSPSTYFKLFLPQQTMTLDKEPLFDYGIINIESFWDANLYKATILKRTIEPKDTCFFYITALYNKGVDGVVRAALALKEQKLFYTITGKEVECGQITFKK